MSRLGLWLTGCLVAVASVTAQADTLSTSIGVHAFPSEGQDETQQSKDEADCYTWSVDRTGTDPFDLAAQAAEQAAAADQAMAQAQSAGQGATGRAAGGGAVAGAFVGGIFGKGRHSAAKGAAVGAATGAIIGSSKKQQAQGQATQQVAADSAQAQAANDAQMKDFRTAFSACLEGKDYIAKF